MAICRISALSLAAALVAQPAAALDLPKLGMPSLFGGGDSKDAPLTPGATADCPLIVVEPGAEMLRTPAGAEASAVKYQISIKSTARECVVEGDHLTIKVGIEGDAILGPAGSPGSYGAAVKVALRRTKDDSGGFIEELSGQRADSCRGCPRGFPPSGRPHRRADSRESAAGL